jgi:hypothetical protein
VVIIVRLGDNQDNTHNFEIRSSSHDMKVLYSILTAIRHTSKTQHIFYNFQKNEKAKYYYTKHTGLARDDDTLFCSQKIWEDATEDEGP